LENLTISQLLNHHSKEEREKFVPYHL